MRFGQTALGSRSAVVTVASNDSDEGSYTFVISGTGEQIPPEPEIVITGNEQSIVDGSVTTSEINFTNFGAFVPGDSTQIRRYRIQNIGEGLLGLGSPMIIGEGFLISNLTSSVLTQGATAEFQVSFPGGLPSGEYLATVTIPNNDPDESNFTFTVRAKNLNALELWRLQNFGESENVGDAANDVDTNRNGVSNLLAYALNLNPFDYVVSVTDEVNPGLPKLIPDGKSTKYRFLIPEGREDLEYVVDVSSNLVNWSRVPIEFVGQQGTYLLMEACAPEELPNCFFRLRVR